MPLKNILNAISTGLDVIGMIPVVGNVASLLNVGVSLARGDLLGAGLNLLGVIPGVGQAVKGVKLLKNLKNLKYLKNIKNAVGSGFNAIKALKAAKLQKIIVGARGSLSKIKAGINKMPQRFKDWLKPPRKGVTFKPSQKIPVDANGYTKSNMKLGQQVHKEYKSTLHNGKDMIKEFRLDSGKRLDFIDFNTKTIYELKPNNPNSIAKGQKQLAGYLKEVESKYGSGWKIVLDLY